MEILVVGRSQAPAVGARLLKCRALLGDDTRGALNGAPCAIAVAPRGYSDDASDLARIGVAYDFTGAADAILLAARGFASECGATLSALYVAPFPTLAYGKEETPGWPEFVEGERPQDEARAAMLDRVDGHIAYGQVGRKLATFSDRVDLLIVGSRGRGPLRSLIFGSTSNYLARHAGCALLIMPRVAALSAATGLVEARPR